MQPQKCGELAKGWPSWQEGTGRVGWLRMGFCISLGRLPADFDQCQLVCRLYPGLATAGV
jgi:hypothetical protein